MGVQAHNYCNLGYYGYVFLRGYWQWLKKLFGNFRLDHFIRDEKNYVFNKLARKKLSRMFLGE